MSYFIHKNKTVSFSNGNTSDSMKLMAFKCQNHQSSKGQTQMPIENRSDTASLSTN